VAEAAVWVIVSIAAATYLGYPSAVIALAARRASRPIHDDGQNGRVSIIICAHNEAANIGAKLASVIRNVRTASVATEIIVADDGSTDDTADIAEAVAVGEAVPIRLLRLPRGGKGAALERACEAAIGDILVFTDADPLWEDQTLARLIAPFADPRVGAVAGEVRTLKSGGGFGSGDRLFRVYESALRRAEDRLFGCVSADGGLFALRASLAGPVPRDVTDDFWLSTAAVAAGQRIAFDPRARVHELSPPGQRQHFRRRVRITVRGLTALWRRRALMNPRRTGWYAIGLIVHKLLRRVVPLLLLPLWALSAWLAWREPGDGYALLFWLMTAWALYAAVLLLLPVRVPRLLRLPLYVAVHVGGLAMGALLFLAGRRYAQWTPHKAVEP
jgi:cellulose synthase/poly-beta-1,6-N-acetylglucosamine synthase-like glycosyltransferase